MDCPICLEPFDNETLVITNCSHRFHLKCLSKIKKDKCPMCRTQIENFKSLNFSYINMIENHHKLIKFCNFCGNEPWDCQEDGCTNKICDCLNNESLFFKSKNPTELDNGLGCKHQDTIRETCLECYKKRWEILQKEIDNINSLLIDDNILDYLYENSELKDIYSIYFKDEFDDYDVFINELDVDILNETTRIHIFF